MRRTRGETGRLCAATECLAAPVAGFFAGVLPEVEALAEVFALVSGAEVFAGAAAGSLCAGAAVAAGLVCESGAV